MRYIWFTLGLISLAIGFAGVVLPLVPTVPMMILAAFFFARSSERLHGWLIEHPTFGPSIQDWQERGAISAKGKRIATLSIAVVFLFSVLLGLKPTILLIQAATLGAVLLFIWSRPNS
ncbi:YbaN family protein [Thalassovita sp.]|uniref:YbaN family protein n=1 Tax=Thalassovita sp. TaxID=1979401 RepID=UPI0029DE8ECE|nr:YbaN family protein [Thalassovita sp.]